ncbi:MAG TPA: hypothetical protein VFR35_13910, partial [Actinoplanes sp.]|nr:hypothetical protein [Actinoplanes sp.]
RGGDPASTAPDRAQLAAGTAAFDLLTRSGSYRRNQHTLTVAEERLVGRCMAGKGLAYPAQPPVASELSDEDQALDLDRRRRDGYGLYRSFAATPAEREQSPSPVDRYVRQLPADQQAAYLLALFGDERRYEGIQLPFSGEVTFPGEGCLFESQSRIYGDTMTWARITYVPEDLNNKLTDLVVASQPYAKALRAWSECMARQGHRYAHPKDAQDDIAARYAAEGPREPLRRHEIEVAVADTECARQAGIPRLLTSSKEDHLGALSAEEQRSLVELGRAWLKAVDVAAEIA